jgi:signal transduction histidine kinase
VARGFWATAFGVACLVAVFALQLAYFSRPGTRLRSRRGYALLGLLALLVVLPWIAIPGVWIGLAGFLAGSALLVLPPAPGWSVFAVVVSAVGATEIGASDFYPRTVGLVFVTVDIGLIVYGVTWMNRTVRLLRAAGRQAAEVALAATRLRFARDLHDLLGLSLSAITLKTDLAGRLMLRDSARAQAELGEALKIARQALTDVRSVASGSHEMSIHDECHAARSLLSTAGVQVRIDAEYGDLSPEVGTVVATVLREGVTNVLRHSRGERCDIAIRRDRNQVLLRIVNDGVNEPDDAGGHGSGIRNMSDRIAALHGTLSAGRHGDGTFVLNARIPMVTADPFILH